MTYITVENLEKNRAEARVQTKNKTSSPVIALLVGLIIGGGVGWSVGKLPAPPITSSSDADVLNQISQYMELPTDEAPEIANVLDPSKLADTPFFAKAQVDDKLILFVGIKKAILYRPSNAKIIEVMPMIWNSEDTTELVTTEGNAAAAVEEAPTVFSNEETSAE
jgi:hypothetical protein